MLSMIKANTQDIEKEYLFQRDIPEDENGFLNEWHNCTFEDFRDRILPVMIANSRGEQLPEGYVPQTFYFVWEDDEIVGQVHIRHYLCESLVNGSGHIGYYIAPEFRGRGLGTKMLALAVRKASKIVPEDEIYLQVNKDNPASLKCMLNNGGYIHHEDGIHYLVRIKKLTEGDYGDKD